MGYKMASQNSKLLIIKYLFGFVPQILRDPLFLPPAERSVPTSGEARVLLLFSFGRVRAAGSLWAESEFVPVHILILAYIEKLVKRNFRGTGEGVPGSPLAVKSLLR